ncbi:hypothetical protein [Paraburkholderia gardini]|uniref:hypothetical protein n=1 Tax=Paraburkholderia gardini TaxID=2823469 RepID=UPI001D7463D3|nr:hypothetical protein [Paraburkholderia gardini]CAG4924810.1 hypothetical protein R69919_05243 [Paraburkholderia gardini]
MRYFQVDITDPQTGEILVPNLNGKPGYTRVARTTLLSSYTSLVQGASVYTPGGTNRAAQEFECDIPVTTAEASVSNGAITLHGVGLGEIAQAANLNGMNIAIYGGMAKGLPLANPQQAGRLASGQILQAFGNWIGSDQALTIIVKSLGSSPTSNQTTGTPSSYTTVPAPTRNAAPANLVFQWKAGQPLLTPLIATLSTAFPKYTISGSVSPNLVWTGADETGYFATLPQLAAYLNQKSLSIIGGYAPSDDYSGVLITLDGNDIVISDGTTATTPKQIQFTDLIGQPTWGQPQQCQITTVLRGDLKVLDYIVLPDAPGTTTTASKSQFFNPQPGSQYASMKSGSIFTGTFLVKTLRHVGASRNPEGTAWVTTLDCILTGQPKNPVSKLPVLQRPNPAYAFYTP